MIATLTGRLASKHPGGVVIDVQGVGYDVLIPLSTYYHLPEPEQPVSLAIYTHVREDALQLFGFRTTREKDAFLLPLSVDGLAAAIRDDDYKVLASVSGIGKKSAGRLALELKDKIEKLAVATDHKSVKPEAVSNRLADDALSALTNLGYRAADVKDLVNEILARDGQPRLQDLIREALKELAK